MEVLGYRVDTSAVSLEEAIRYIETFGPRYHARRIQHWLDHCARIRKDPKSRSPDWSCDPRLVSENKSV